MHGTCGIGGYGARMRPVGTGIPVVPSPSYISIISNISAFVKLEDIRIIQPDGPLCEKREQLPLRVLSRIPRPESSGA